jgi:hypothetical protein
MRSLKHSKMSIAKALTQSLAAALTAFALAGCAGHQDAAVATAPTPAQLQIEQQKEQAHFSGPTQQAIYKQHALDSAVHPVATPKS